MPKSRNDLNSVTITITTTPQVRRALQRLVKTGFYGKNPAEAAERLLAQTLEQHVREGRIPSSGTGRTAR